MKIITDEIREEIKEEMYEMLDALIEENELDDYVDWDAVDKLIEIDIKVVNKFLSDGLTDVIKNLETMKEINENAVMYRLTAKENENAVFCVGSADKTLENVMRYIINRVTKVPENRLTIYERDRVMQIRKIDCRKEVLADVVRAIIEREIQKAIENGDGIIMQTYRLAMC